MSKLKYWVWLASCGAGQKAAFDALGFFGSPEAVFFTRSEELSKHAWLKTADAERMSDKSLAETERILADCAENEYRIITFQDAEYPERLRNISVPPLILYVRGRLPALDEEAAIGIVGTRSCTPYGIKHAERIGYELAREGAVVVTGLARGIDTASARGALRGGGKVIGVLGGGLDVVYPAENRYLYDDVAMSGALISEYPPGTPTAGKHFPVRNRIISGISLGVAVIEAPKRSGALITAEHAFEQGRDVFAMPGNVDSPASEGTNALLREFASPLINASDILEEYRPLFPYKLGGAAKDKVPIAPDMEERLVSEQLPDGGRRQETTKKVIDKPERADYIDLVKLTENLSENEKKVVNAIGAETLHVDEIAMKSGLSIQDTLAALTLLEISGVVAQGHGKHFSIA